MLSIQHTYEYYHYVIGINDEWLDWQWIAVFLARLQVVCVPAPPKHIKNILMFNIVLKKPLLNMLKHMTVYSNTSALCALLIHCVAQSGYCCFCVPWLTHIYIYMCVKV